MRKSTRIATGLAMATAVVAGGTAFTASNTLAPSATKGYGSQQITGVTAQSVTYNTSSNGEHIDTVTLVLTGDTTGKDIRIAFNDASPLTCSDEEPSVKTHDGNQIGWDNTDPENPVPVYEQIVDTTTYDCFVGGQAVAGATKFALVAVEKDDADYSQQLG